MPIKKSKGQMYPWVTHTHSHLGGECPHKCVYCYVDNPKYGRPERYKGEIRLIQKELTARYGKGNTIFIENTGDLFAKEVPDWMIREILRHCWTYPENTYVFQTKNPARYFDVYMRHLLLPKALYGCTIETNRKIPPEISKAPATSERCLAMRDFNGRKFITIEPILDFDLEEFLRKKEHQRSKPRMTKEAAQVGAMAIRFLVDILDGGDL